MGGMPEGQRIPRESLQPYFSTSGHRRDLFLLQELQQWLQTLRSRGWLKHGIGRHEIREAPSDVKGEEVIVRHVRNADLVFVLLSVAYLNSKECIDSELAPALALQEAGLVQVIIIYLRPLPPGEIPVLANGQSYDLRRWDWHPKKSGRHVDHYTRLQRDFRWRDVEEEVRTLVAKRYAELPLESLTAEELAEYFGQDEDGLAKFLDCFTRVIGAGFATGAGQQFPWREQIGVAQKIFYDLFFVQNVSHRAIIQDLYDRSRHPSFAHFLFKLAYISGRKKNVSS